MTNLHNMTLTNHFKLLKSPIPGVYLCRAIGIVLSFDPQKKNVFLNSKKFKVAILKSNKFFNSIYLYGIKKFKFTCKTFSSGVEDPLSNNKSATSRSYSLGKQFIPLFCLITHCFCYSLPKGNKKLTNCKQPYLPSQI